MTSIVNSVWGLASHRMVQAAPIQAIGLGNFLMRNGWHASLRIFSDTSSLSSRVLSGALGALAFGYGGHIAWQGAAHIWNTGFEEIYSAYFPSEEESSLGGELHPYEQDIESFHKSIQVLFGIGDSSPLHFDGADPLPKLLWLTAAFDSNGALKPFYRVWKRIQYLIEDRMDVKYQVITHPRQFCQAVQSAVKIGNLTTLVLHGHGNNGVLLFTKYGHIGVLQPLPDGCFAGVPQDLKIFLTGCYAGTRLTPLNIAEWISWSSGKTVYASSELVRSCATGMSLDDSGELALDFCKPSETSSYLDGCEESMTRVFHPPETAFEHGVYAAKIGLSALSGLFIASELIRLTLAIPLLAARTFLKCYPSLSKN